MTLRVVYDTFVKSWIRIAVTSLLVYTLDTNAIIHYQKRDPRVVLVLRGILGDPTASVYVPTITEAELFNLPNDFIYRGKQLAEKALGSHIVLLGLSWCGSRHHQTRRSCLQGLLKLALLVAIP